MKYSKLDRSRKIFIPIMIAYAVIMISTITFEVFNPESFFAAVLTIKILISVALLASYFYMIIWDNREFKKRFKRPGKD